MMTTSSILGQFDLCAESAEFPDLQNGYYYPVDARLHLFADATRWAMVVELLGYSPRAGNLTDVLHRYGNCLTRGEPGLGEFLDRVENMEEVEPEGGEEYGGAVPLVVRGTPLRVAAHAGTPLDEVFRLLVPHHRDLLLADETELRAGIPADLPLLLKLDEWNQPDDFWDTLPGDHETFRQLAEVLATGDPTRYRPTLPPNTHWSHWPDAGTL
ncbi:DUF7003 family protein [Streptomyces aurantiogriseus]|uniref:Uncharacterized protein n=1 Tax=Streptomyces aurantiogriseus TaxID=66870 RepID=A0A918BW91_9ACTN|nr:hypothetical protein [Streptomyces aurantiogriseus]GGQ94010.1 hypothetical protein GCM10010251_06020 [Streptomyces aurantiogriseus]